MAKHRPGTGRWAGVGRFAKKRWTVFQKNKELFALSLPAVTYLIVFAYIPLFGLVLAFKNFRFDLGIFGSKWVGFDNFKFFFVSDQAFLTTRNTLMYGAGYLLGALAFALVFAIMLNEVARRAAKTYQTAMLLPFFLSWVLVSYVTDAFLNHHEGYLNGVLRLLAVEPVDWYLVPAVWPFILNAVYLWKTIGFHVLIFYSGIMGIESEYQEAARIDGASRWQMASRITFPLLMPLAAVLLIIGVGGLFRGNFGLHYFIPNDSPFLYSTTDVIDTYAYHALRKLGEIGMATAVGLYQSVGGLFFVLFANYAVRKFSADHSLW
ncbi:putative aldouronate transport system permease protein [Cohnella sp. SGD-V74]|uniref:ABC transporter permease n=1 Tax=unclassified Cohnella TaxID=2636738 RepID=UPI000D49B4AD|nr:MULTISPECIES: ABC transporter permease subunit [unclassified Cohnella]PRX72354.1 putative aldouronate transport system permease protein [Cohnella sp. SGD-V74]